MNMRRYILLSIVSTVFLGTFAAHSAESSKATMKPERLFSEAQQQLNSGEYAVARESFLSYLEVRPDSAEAYLRLGFIELQLDKLEASIRYLERAVDLGNQDPTTFLILATAANRYGLLDKARDAYLEAIKRNPRAPNAYHELGLIYFRQNNMMGAIEALKKALEISPDSPQTLFALGMTYVKADQSELAMDLITHLRQLQENDKATQLENLARTVRDRSTFIEPSEENLAPQVAHPSELKAKPDQAAEE